MIKKRNYKKNKLMMVIYLKIRIKKIKKEKLLIKSRRNKTRIKNRRSRKQRRRN
jgi:hypothetical protein